MLPGWSENPRASARALHHCHAIGCKERCPPEHLMCRRHWFMVPKALRDEVWRTYREGQCDDMKPSRAWYRAARRAIEVVAMKENKLPVRIRVRGRART